MAFTPTSGPNESALSYESEGGGDPKKGWHRLSKWFSRESDKPPPKESPTPERDTSKPGLGRRISRRVVPGLPRPATFKRINSERRERLMPVQPAADEKRALSVDRRKLMKDRPRSVPPNDAPRLSAPAVCGRQGSVVDEEMEVTDRIERPSTQGAGMDLRSTDSMISPTSTILNPQTAVSEPLPSLLPPFSPDEHPHPPLSPPLDSPDSLPDSVLDDIDEEALRAEHEDRWILNLSMHFRDRSPREKFFVTYAETPTKWRRITVSVDYRDAPPDSLEHDLQNLSYQRDKSFRIYESIRASLPEIQWYDTVTNLRLETSADDRLHVHVTEDVNEIISYPSVRLLDHIDVPRIPEQDVEFDSHMSGFVYKVRVQDKTLIKKEIPGPDSVEEFLYEVNALYALIGSPNVVQFEGLVVDDDEGLVKGILIAYAEQGPLVDIIYDYKHHLTWERREKWAWQIVNGLAEIHESGFVQGDFTLSNIVIDENDAAIIIDINRRGCPVGWEPPEIARMIQSGQRISMYIGVKSDLFQLGMVLWALAEEEDEPDRQDRPLSLEHTKALVPQYFKDIVAACLDMEPRQRESAKSLLARFPDMDPDTLSTAPLQQLMRPAGRLNVSETPYIDPRAAIGHADLPTRSQSRHSRSRVSSRSRAFSDSRTYIEGRPSSTDIPFDGPSSYIVPRRGRSPPTNSTHVRPSSIERRRSVSISADDDPQPQLLTVSPSNELKWEELVDTDGSSFLVETDEDPIERQARIQRSAERMRQTSLTEAALKLAHVDSGLADMDGFSRRSTELDGLGRASTGFSMHRASTGLSLGRGSRYPNLALRSLESPKTRHVSHTDSGLADMDLVGVGGNEALKDYGHQDSELDIGEQPSDLVTVGENEVVQDFTSEVAHADNNAKESAVLGMHAEGERRPTTDTDTRQNIASATDTHGANGVG